MNNVKIIKIRKKLDNLDDNLLNIIKKRSILVSKILKQKRYKNQIIDKKRIKTILKNIKKKSIRKKVDPIITYKIWNSMINAFIDYEYRNFKNK
ncbi:MAG: chorismate mutase [Pelagibacteraceae bacterium TMED287]|nr:MAG: chorismate mutase [Pelagibacteraceae bacterium TMED287]|tara:strand:+ start:510 stop:791 length:282 start_codon:yes stop_codon:yes gene_type:complete